MRLAPAQYTSVPFALSSLAIHYGIALLQNIDFLSWWGPAYAFLLADPAVRALQSGACPTDGASALGLVSSVRAALGMAPLHAPLALGYAGLILPVAVLLRFFPPVNMLLLSTFPMFGVPHNVFDGAHSKWL